MNNIQIYLLVLVVLHWSITFLCGVFDPNGTFKQWTHLQRLAALPIGIAVWLPIYGRVLGWW